MKTHIPILCRIRLSFVKTKVIPTLKLFKTLRVFLFVASFFSFVNAPQCQSIARQFLGGMGGSFNYDNNQFRWTGGEMSIAHLNTSYGKFKVTQGYQQPQIHKTANGVNTNNWVSADPNPVIDFLRIRQLQASPEGMFLRIMNAQGQQMYSPQELATLPDELDLSKYASGIYFVQILHVDYSVIQVIKIVKVKS